MTDNVEEAPKLEALVGRYVKLRDRKAGLKAAYDASVADIDTAMGRVEGYLQNLMNTMGVESLRTEAGTAYQSLRTSCTAADWESYLGWVRANEHWSALEHRVSKTFVEAYKQEHNDLPPGVNWSEARVVNIRRS